VRQLPASDNVTTEVDYIVAIRHQATASEQQTEKTEYVL
jgi:hypothetical protein